MASVFFDPAVGGDGSTVSDDADPLTGLRRAGYKIRFVPALQQMVAVASTVVLQVTAAAGSAASALISANSAELAQANALISANAAAAQASVATAKAGEASASASSAALSLAGTLAAAGLSGARAYSSYALALGDFANLVNNQTVFVVTDETRGNQGAYYRATGTPVASLTFLRLHEFYASPVPYIQSDSVQNMITKLLVLTGAIPQNPAVIDANFADPAYL